MTDARERGSRSTESQLVEGLVAAAAGGDRAAQEDLFKRYWPAIRQVVRACRYRNGNRLGGHEQTQDLEQEVALAVLLALPRQQWQGKHAFRAWVNKLAAARVVDAQRYHLAGRRDRRRETGVEKAEELRPAGASPESRMDDQRRLEALATQLDRLKPQYAGAVMLHHIGYSHQEIGDMLGCSAEAARKLVSRGEAQLVRLCAAAPGLVGPVHRS